MELKQDLGGMHGGDYLPFNRTSMELKQYSINSSSIRKYPFNRTSMELKPARLASRFSCRASFNRTSMELKLIYLRLFNYASNRLLIEPVWN